MLKKWQVLLGIIVALFTISGALLKAGQSVDARYSKAEECKQANETITHQIRLTQQRLEQKILYDRILGYDERIQRIEDKNNCHTFAECENVLRGEPRETYRHFQRMKKDAEKDYEAIGEVD